MKTDFGTTAAVPQGEIPPEYAKFNNFDPKVNAVLANQICATPYQPSTVATMDASPGQLVAATGTWFAAALGAGLIAVLLAPAVAAASVTFSRHGAFDTPFEPAQTAQDVKRAGETPALLNPSITQWQTRQDGAPDLMAAQTVALPSLVIYDRGIEALPIGGVDGTTPSPTLGQLQADIRRGLFHLVWILSDTDPRMQWIASHCARLSLRFYNCEPADAP